MCSCRATLESYLRFLWLAAIALFFVPEKGGFHLGGDETREDDHEMLAYDKFCRLRSPERVLARPAARLEVVPPAH